MNKSQTKALDFLYAKISEKAEENRDMKEGESYSCDGKYGCQRCYNGIKNPNIYDIEKYKAGYTCIAYILKNDKKINIECMTVQELQKEINEFKDYLKNYKKQELKI